MVSSETSSIAQGRGQAFQGGETLNQVVLLVWSGENPDLAGLPET